MTPEEHYKKAEELLEQARDSQHGSIDGLLQAAQAHATLATCTYLLKG